MIQRESDFEKTRLQGFVSKGRRLDGMRVWLSGWLLGACAYFKNTFVFIIFYLYVILKNNNKSNNKPLKLMTSPRPLIICHWGHTHFSIFNNIFQEINVSPLLETKSFFLLSTIPTSPGPRKAKLWWGALALCWLSIGSSLAGVEQQFCILQTASSAELPALLTWAWLILSHRSTLPTLSLFKEFRCTSTAPALLPLTRGWGKWEQCPDLGPLQRH